MSANSRHMHARTHAQHTHTHNTQTPSWIYGVDMIHEELSYDTFEIDMIHMELI